MRRNRCADFGVGQVELGAAQACGGGGELGLGLRGCLHPALVFRAGDGPVALQLGAAIALADGEGQPRLRRLDVRPGPLDGGPVRLGIDRDEKRALLDQRAFREMGGEHRPRDARADVDPLDRLEAAGMARPELDRAALDAGDRGRHRGRRRRLCGLGPGRRSRFVAITPRPRKVKAKAAATRLAMTAAMPFRTT